MSTLTPNLQLVKPDGTDNINIGTLNNNFDILDSEIEGLKTDYVVFQGIKGFWTYRRWASGIFECWGKVTAKNVNNHVAGGTFDLPITLASSSYTINATIGNGGFFNSKESLDVNAKAWGNTTSVSVFANSVNAIFSTYKEVDIHVDIKGRWK